MLEIILVQGFRPLKIKIITQLCRMDSVLNNLRRISISTSNFKNFCNCSQVNIALNLIEM